MPRIIQGRTVREKQGTTINARDGCSLEQADCWYGNKNNSDVVVSLIPRRSNCKKTLAASASFNQGSTSEDGKILETNSLVGRKRKQRTDLKPNVQVVHVHSHQLRRCSKYFDTCLSERWAGAGVETEIVHLSLDVHTDVECYMDCFSRMYSSGSMDIPGVKHCLKLLRVAVQISYQALVEECVSYLATIPWSQDDEMRIRKFAKSLDYPSECAGDLSARLGLPLACTKRHGYMVDMMQDVLLSYFDDAMRIPFADQFHRCVSSRDLFSSAFTQFLVGPCQGFVESVLKHVNNGVKKYISEAELDPSMVQADGLDNLLWILNVLLKRRCAKELVEYIVEQSTLEEALKRDGHEWELSWFNLILSIFKEMNEGHLLLKTSTRFKLLQQWTSCS